MIYHMGHLICWELMLVNEIILLLSEGHEHRRFLVSSSSDRDISWVFEIRYDGINQKLNLRNTYRILNIQFSVHQLPSHMMYDVINIFRCLAIKSFPNLLDRSVHDERSEVLTQKKTYFDINYLECFPAFKKHWRMRNRAFCQSVKFHETFAHEFVEF